MTCAAFLAPTGHRRVGQAGHAVQPTTNEVRDPVQLARKALVASAVPGARPSHPGVVCRFPTGLPTRPPTETKEPTMARCAVCENDDGPSLGTGTWSAV
jgi:hypothetical protein